ncbi:hypothetical protein AAG570_001417 [Ranatra chinensis]|uniref:Uncharacterized protein n=1 Tax=Ranatra chinensis TaxID=642074 RepID=A0ABD0YBV3_9HEMI
MASKRRNMFQKNKTQETTKNAPPDPGDDRPPITRRRRAALYIGSVNQPHPFSTFLTRAASRHSSRIPTLVRSLARWTIVVTTHRHDSLVVLTVVKWSREALGCSGSTELGPSNGRDGRSRGGYRPAIQAAGSASCQQACGRHCKLYLSHYRLIMSPIQRLNQA